MSTDRHDELLQRSLASGAVPADTTASERAELEPLLAVASAATRLRPAVQAESQAALPTARARFQRYVAAESAAAVLPGSVPPGPRFLGRVFAANRALTMAVSVGVIGLFALLAVVASQSFGGVETAAAQVLDESDYAQIQGVITATTGEGATRTATLSSDFGDLQLALGELPGITNADQVLDTSTLKAGDSVTVAGTVTKKDNTTSVAARSVAVGKSNANPAAKPRLIQLRELRKGLEGRVTVFAVAKDGKAARVVLDTGNGEQFIVPVAAGSLAELLSANEALVGRRVTVSHEVGSPKGEFTLTAVPLSTAPVGSRLGLSGVAGVILSREGNFLRVQTERGPAQVLLTAQTRIVIGPGADLSVERIRTGNAAVGHAVVIQGGVDRTTGRLTADVVWVGASTR
ncbi:MAG: hypothetical protein ABIP13_04985 [Tepidiformaceae bacterium]